jgi:putative transposase
MATGVCTCSYAGRVGAATANAYNGFGGTKGYVYHQSHAGAGEDGACQVTSKPPARNQVWALDFLVDRTADGRPIKILAVTDEHTREALATPAARRITSDDTVATLEQIVERRGTSPVYIRCDNGPELTAEALKDWCRFNRTTVSYIEPGAPWQNPFVESFNGHLRSELLDLESFNTLLEAQILLDDWRLDYNHHRPHQSLNYQTPAAFAHQWHADHDHRSS